MILFDQNHDNPIVLEKNCDEAIFLAAKDLQRDLLALSGKENAFPFKESAQDGIFIKTVQSGEIETYSIFVTETGVEITGSDVLGTVFGIYAFSTKYLGVPETHQFTDLFPEKKASLELEPSTYHAPEKSIRFRGWFVNDEDLLSEWRLSGHRRNLNYRYYVDILSPEVLDKVMETALRLEYNLIIPATLLDIDNPPEEKLVECAYRRGMFISQHHIEPMGLSGFAAEKFLERYNRNETISFISNPAFMEEIWRFYAKKWSKYASRVVWQLGLRGKKDEAVWKTDPNAPLSMEGRGKIISDAIGTQHRILTEILGTTDFYSTTTLWNEGSVLYGNGYLTLPENTIPILADFGIDQLFGEDMFTTKKEEGRNYGVYYHTSFWALGPHFCEGCHPEKMAYSYRIAEKENCLYYSMLNISNVRPVHFSITMNARILNDPAGIDIRKTVEAFDESIFGDFGKEVTDLRYEYYDSFCDFGSDLGEAFANQWFFFYHKYPALPFIRNAATDGQLTWIGKYALLEKLHCEIDFACKDRLPALLDGEEKLSRLYNKMQKFQENLPEKARLYFKQFLMYQTRHLLLLTRWCIAVLDLTDHALPTEVRKQRGEEACLHLETLLKEREILEVGQWENWHRGDKKMNLPEKLQETKNYLAKL